MVQPRTMNQALAAPATGRNLKPSRFNVFVHRGDSVWAYNTRSGAFAHLEVVEHLRILKLLDDPRPTDSLEEALLEKLQKGQFLIPEGLDELKLLKVRNRLSRFSARGLGLVIAPTLRCNFDCPYCYVDRNANRMTEEARARVKKFFSRKMEESPGAAVCWTGGDPSLALGVVEDLSAHFIAACEEYDGDYDAVMITNGYLLDGRMVSRLKGCRIHAVQVTLDGGEEYHNATRSLAGGRPTFDRILKNVGAASAQIKINLRINVDDRNWRSIPRLVERLAEEGIAERNVSLHFAHVQPINALARKHEESCLTLERYAALEPELLALAHEMGFGLSTQPIQGQVSTFCGANSRHHYVIDSKARLQKCYDDLGRAETEGIGYIDKDGNEVVDKHANLLEWLSWDPFDHQECIECKVLPLCMGGCSYHTIRNGEEIGSGCLKLRHNLNEIVELYGRHLRDLHSKGSDAPGCVRSQACAVVQRATPDEGR